MKKLAALALALLALLALAAPAMARHKWGSYHWARTTPTFTVPVLDRVDDAKWGSYLNEALSVETKVLDYDPEDPFDWNDDAFGNPVRTSAASPDSGSPSTCDPVAGKVAVCNAAYGQNGWLGLAQIWLAGGHISQGTAKMNDTYFNTASYDNPGDRRLVMCQEVGHTFGLGHQDERHRNVNLGTCMDYTNDADGGQQGPSNERPNRHDYEMLAQIYGAGHKGTDTTTTVSTQATRGQAPYHTQRRDTPGHTEIVEHFSDGSAKVTDILWAKGR